MVFSRFPGSNPPPSRFPIFYIFKKYFFLHARYSRIFEVAALRFLQSLLCPSRGQGCKSFLETISLNDRFLIRFSIVFKNDRFVFSISIKKRQFFRRRFYNKTIVLRKIKTIHPQPRRSSWNLCQHVTNITYKGVSFYFEGGGQYILMLGLGQIFSIEVFYY